MLQYVCAWFECLISAGIFAHVQDVKAGVKAALTAQQIRQLAEALGYDADGRRKMILIAQHAYYVVYVPPCFWHWVANLQVGWWRRGVFACVKRWW